MGRIDVSELLTDPDFVDKLSIIRRASIVDPYGQNQLSESAFQTVGSVQPASGKTIMRLPEALRVVNVSSFWIKGTIVADGSCKYPDIIFFRGVRYAVQVIFDWTNWGAGWCEGTCVREKPSV